MPKEDRPAVGKTINEFKQWAEGQYQALSVQVEQAALAARNAAETVDITMPPKVRLNGSLHPITLVKNEIVDVFAGMGFEIYEGPEIEDDDEVETYKLVTTVRGNSMKGLISSESPLGSAIMGHRVGDRVYVRINEKAGYYVVVKRLENTTDDSSDKLRSY